LAKARQVSCNKCFDINCVGIAIRRFAERLEKDSALLSKLSHVQKALELR
jgi:hypothetical protein